MRRRWPQRTFPMNNGAAIMLALLLLGDVTNSDFVYGLQGLWFFWWVGTILADWIDRRHNDLGNT